MPIFVVDYAAKLVPLLSCDYSDLSRDAELEVVTSGRVVGRRVSSSKSPNDEKQIVS